jgi:hypothetical protein
MKVFIIAGHLSRFRSLADKTLQLTFETQEPTPEMVMNIQKYLLNTGFLAFSPDPFLTHELEEIDKMKVEFDDNRKSQSWRIRAHLYKLWEQHNEGFDSFEMYYNHHTEKYINHLKSRLLPDPK